MLRKVDLSQRYWFLDFVSYLMHEELPASLNPVAIEEKTVREKAKTFTETFLKKNGFAYRGEPEVYLSNWLRKVFSFPEECRDTLETIAFGVLLVKGLAKLSKTRASRIKIIAEFTLFYTVLFGLTDKASELYPDLDKMEERNGSLPSSFRHVALELDSLLIAEVELSKDPLYQLTCQNAFRYAQMKLFSHLALDYYTEKSFNLNSAITHFHRYQEEKKVFVETNIHMAWADGELTFEEKYFMRHLIYFTQLPLMQQRNLLAKLLERKELADIPSHIIDSEMKDFILDQVILSSYVGGYQIDQERNYLYSLGKQFGYPTEEIERRHTALLNFFEKHRTVLDYSFLGIINRTGDGVIAHFTKFLMKYVSVMAATIQDFHIFGRMTFKLIMGNRLRDAENEALKAMLTSLNRKIYSAEIFKLPGGSWLFTQLVRFIPPTLLPR